MSMDFLMYSPNAEFYRACKSFSEARNRCINFKASDLLELSKTFFESETSNDIRADYAVNFYFDENTEADLITNIALYKKFDDKRLHGKRVISYLYEPNYATNIDCELNVEITADCIEKSKLLISGWIRYKSKNFQEIKFICNDPTEAICDYTKGKTHTPGFIISASYTVAFSSENGQKQNIKIELVSRYLQEMQIRNIYKDIENDFLGKEYAINSICSGWHKIFGEYRYISPLSLSTAKSPKMSKENFEKTLNGILKSDYKLLVFFFSIYSMCKSFLSDSKNPIALNILTNDENHNAALNIARTLSTYTSFKYRQELYDSFCVNSTFKPQNYMKQQIGLAMGKEVNPEAKYGKFRDCVIVSSGKYVSNKYDRKDESSETIFISESLLNKKLNSKCTNIFFNLENQSNHFITYTPNNNDLIQADCSDLCISDLIKSFITYIEKNINLWGIQLCNKQLKEIHNKIIYEVNTNDFEITSLNFMIYIISNYMNEKDFVQKIRYSDMVELYESNQNRKVPKDKETIINMADKLYKNVIYSGSIKGEQRRVFNDIIDDIGYSDFYQSEKDFELFDKEKRDEIISQMLNNAEIVDEFCDKYAKRWSDEYKKRLFKKLCPYPKVYRPKIFTEKKVSAALILKDFGFDKSARQKYQNIFAMALYFEKFVDNSFPECTDLCRKMLRRLTYIFSENENKHKRISDVERVTMHFSSFIIQNAELSLNISSEAVNNTPLYYFDQNTGEPMQNAGVYKAKGNQLCYYVGDGVMEAAFEKYLEAKGFTTDVSIKKCISEVLIPAKAICVYKNRYSCEVTVNKVSRYAYKFYMDELKVCLQQLRNQFK